MKTGNKKLVRISGLRNRILWEDYVYAVYIGNGVKVSSVECHSPSPIIIRVKTPIDIQVSDENTRVTSIELIKKWRKSEKVTCKKINVCKYYKPLYITKINILL